MVISVLMVVIVMVVAVMFVILIVMQAMLIFIVIIVEVGFMVMVVMVFIHLGMIRIKMVVLIDMICGMITFCMLLPYIMFSPVYFLMKFVVLRIIILSSMKPGPAPIMIGVLVRAMMGVPLMGVTMVITLTTMIMAIIILSMHFIPCILVRFPLSIVIIMPIPVMLWMRVILGQVRVVGICSVDLDCVFLLVITNFAMQCEGPSFAEWLFMRVKNA